MSMRCVEVKLIVKNELTSTIEEVVAQIKTVLNSNNYRTIHIGSNVDLESLSNELQKNFDCSTRAGVSGGCYGARDGSHYNGLTVWVHPSELVDRYVDSDYGELVNPWHLLNEYGEEIEDLDAEKFLEVLDAAGIEYKSDNTYNYSGCNSDDAGFIFDFQFDHIELNDTHFLAVMFHCGGDVRGNYTSKTLYKFKHVEDVYSVIFPHKFLTEEV